MPNALKPIDAVSPTLAVTTLFYTAPGDNTVVVNLIVHNPSAIDTATYSIHRVPNGDSADDTNKVVDDQPLSPKERHSWDDKLFMDSGDTLYIVSDIADVSFAGNVLEIS